MSVVGTQSVRSATSLLSLPLMGATSSSSLYSQGYSSAFRSLRISYVGSSTAMAGAAVAGFTLRTQTRWISSSTPRHPDLHSGGGIRNDVLIPSRSFFTVSNTQKQQQQPNGLTGFSSRSITAAQRVSVPLSISQRFNSSSSSSGSNNNSKNSGSGDTGATSKNDSGNQEGVAEEKRKPLDGALKTESPSTLKRTKVSSQPEDQEGAPQIPKNVDVPPAETESIHSQTNVTDTKPAPPPHIPRDKDASLAPVAGENPRDIPVKRVLMQVLKHLWPVGQPKMRALVVASVACVLLAKVFRIAVPFWFKSVVDVLAPASTTASAVATVGPWTVGVFSLVAAFGIFRLTSSFTEEVKTALFAPVGSYAATTVAMEMFSKIHTLDLRFHLNRQTGVLAKDLDRGSRAFWSLAYTLLFMIVPTVFEMCLVCLALNGQAGSSFVAIAFAAVTAYTMFTFTVTNWRAKYRARYNAADSRVGGLVVDSLLNYETIKYFGSEKYEYNRMYKETEQLNFQLKRLDQTMAVLNFGQQAIFVAAGTLSLYLATCGVIAGTMTVGDLVLVDALLMQLYVPLSYMGMLYREIQTSTQNMQAMISLLDQGSTVKDSPNAVPFVYKDGTIELKNVCFHYSTDTPRHVLRNVSLTIPGGSTVAFVGPSGSGKSTVFRLLFRFFDPTSGEVLIDGQRLTDVQTASFRESFGVIPQDCVLFNDTVRYNIRYGNRNATDAQVEEAARAASLHSSIVALSEGYDTVVGERGLKLSGGEKQRVAIARVMLYDAPILLADEATSALDSKTEVNVMTTLKSAMPNNKRTIVMIAHRLSTVRTADIIFVLDTTGHLAEQGSHDELLAKGGVYSDLWNQQQKEREVPH